MRIFRSALVILLIAGCTRGDSQTSNSPAQSATAGQAAPPAAVAPSPAAVPELNDAGKPRWHNPRTGASFDNDVAAFGRKDQTDPPPKDAILFLGASSVRLWTTLAADLPEYRVINRGFGGAQTTDVIHYLDQVLFPYSPAVIVFYPGGDNSEFVLADFKDFLKSVRSRLPATPIVFMSLLAKPAQDSATVARVREANRRVKEFVATQPGLSFIDVFTEIIDHDGRARKEFFGEDGLHTNERGYALWTKLIREHLAGIDAAGRARKTPLTRNP